MELESGANVCLRRLDTNIAAQCLANALADAEPETKAETVGHDTIHSLHLLSIVRLKDRFVLTLSNSVTFIRHPHRDFPFRLRLHLHGTRDCDR